MKNIITFLLLLILFPIIAIAEPALTPLDGKRIKKLTHILNSGNSGYADPINNRTYWDEIAKTEAGLDIIKRAEGLAKKGMPAWKGALMVEFQKTGIRKIADDMYKSRSKRLMPLVVAECLENKGRFIPAIEETLRGYCEQPSWVMVAHDTNLDNFYGREYHVDLGSASMSDEIGQTLYMLKGKLKFELVKEVKAKLYERVYKPVLESYRTLGASSTKHGWITRNNNWNLVCIAGVTSSALAVIDDLKLRAEFVAAAEKYIQYGINGFLEDGYCPEGVGYYNYGFSYLIRLREALYRASHGQLDLFEHPRMYAIAKFGEESEIINEVYPAITDCRPGTPPSEYITWYCGKSFGWDLSNVKKDRFEASSDGLIREFSNSPCRLQYTYDCKPGIRTYFNFADVLVCRPDRHDWNSSLGLVVKGGNNNESHNHNDVCSFTIVSGNDIMMGDMGGPTAYTAKTFSAERYELYPMFSSYGHPVPLVDGIQQHASGSAKGEIIESKFDDNTDKVVYDLKSAYEHPDLVAIERVFVYDRKDGGQVEVVDQFEAKKAINFETAITTRQSVETINENTLKLISKDTEVLVTIEASGPIEISESEVSAYAFESFKRLGIQLKNPSTKGSIKVKYNTL